VDGFGNSYVAGYISGPATFGQNERQGHIRRGRKDPDHAGILVSAGGVEDAFIASYDRHFQRLDPGGNLGRFRDATLPLVEFGQSP
jgi:hypothetical protein